jgi:hypothetical protein
MACWISFKERFVPLNNTQFDRLIELGIEVAEQTASQPEREIVERMKKLRAEQFWPGRGIDIGKDFPNSPEQKFWSRVFLDTARAILDQRVGVHDRRFWQAQAIHQSYATGLLFQDAVRDAEPDWTAETLDRREYREGS